jgi:hypothetical protein
MRVIPRLNGFWQQRSSAAGLAVFRICYFLVLFWEVLEYWLHRHLIFDTMPYLESGSPILQALLPFWMAAVALLLVGCFTPYAALANFVCSTLILGDMTDYEYHFDHISQSINFLLIFAPVSAAWSLDAWRKQKHPAADLPVPSVHPIYYYLFLIVGIGIVYLDSALWKLCQPTWQQGLGVWRPMSVTSFTWGSTAYLQFLLDQQWFMILANHLTLFLETAFLFLVWSHFCRLWILLPVGVMLHVGIILAFPIPRFSLVMLALYTLVVPPTYWERLITRIRRSLTENSAIQLPHHPVTSAANSVGFWNYRSTVAAVSVLLISLCAVQGIIILQDREFLSYENLTWHHREEINRYTGICMHGVFIDPHWTNYDHVIALVHALEDGSFEWLPLTTPTGQMGSLATGRLWAHWGFRTNSAGISNELVEKGVKRLSAYWLGAQALPFDEAKFLVLTKATKPCSGWRKNELTEQMAMPWQVTGEVNWHANKCDVRLMPLRASEPLSVTAHPFIPPLVSPFSKAASENMLLGSQKITIHR